MNRFNSTPRAMFRAIALMLFALFLMHTDAQSQAVLQTESFESTIFPAPGWRQVKGTPNVLSVWSRQAQATSSFPTATALAGGGSQIMMLNSDAAGTPSNPDVALMISKPFDFSNNGGVNPEFKFNIFRDNISTVASDVVKVYINTTPTMTGALLLTNASGTTQISRYHNSFPAVTANTWQQITYSLPAATYNQKKYYFIIEGICTGGANLYLDLFTTNTFPSASNAGDVSFDMFTQNAISVGPNTTNNMIVGVRCIMGGTSGNGVVNGASSNAVKLDSLLLNTTGTTNVNDIQNAKIWYTGGSNLFSTGYISPFPVTAGSDDYPTAQYGTTIAVPATNLDFTNGATSCFYLEYDTTYFWLTYDVKPTGVGGNNLDADFRGASVGGPAGQCPSPINSTTSITPGVFTLTGACQIDLPYCVPTYTVGTAWANYTNNDYIQSVVLVGVAPTSINTNFGASNNNAGLPAGLGCYPNCDFTAHPPDYQLWPAVAGRTVVLIQGSSYSITVQAGTWYSSNYIQAWIDFNKNGFFEPIEALFQTNPAANIFLPNLAANATATYNFTVPAGSFVGPTRLRVREVYANSNPDPCLNYTYGETEDFSIIISPNCPASYKLWLGNNRNWHDPVNWCGGVPTILDSAVVDKAQVPGASGRAYFPPTILSQGNPTNQANAKSLWISAADSLIVDAPLPASPALKVATNIINNGRIEVIGGLGATSSAVTYSNGTLQNALYSPFRSNASDSRMQIIYTAAELAAQGLIAGDQITAIRCSTVTKFSTSAFQNYTIGYALIPAATTQHISNVPQAAALTTVFGPTAYTTVLGLNTFTLTAPMVWDGTSNLLVQFCYDNAAKNGTAADAIYITQTDGGGRKSVLLLTTSIDNSGSGCSLTPGAGIIDNLFASYGSYRPNFTFVLNRVYGKPQITVQKDWINNGSFVPSSSRVLMDSTVNQILGGSQPSTFHELQINKGASAQNVTMQRAVTVQDTLLLNQGSLIMNGNTLSITNPAPSTGTHTNFAAINGPITRTNGFIISESPGSFSSTSTTVGSFVKWTVGTTQGWRVIPFGDNAATPVLIPLTFLHNSGDLGTFSVATYRATANNPFPPTVSHLNIFSSTANNATNTVDRFWVTEKTGSNPNTSISFRWSDAENSGASALNPPRAQPWRYTTTAPGSEAWLRITNTSPTAPVGSILGTSVSYTQVTPYIAAGVADSVRVQNWDWPIIPAGPAPHFAPAGPIGNFVPWAIANNNTPLPVELLSFNADVVKNKVRLSWITASEINNDYFTVERTDPSDMDNFDFIAKVNSYMNNSTMMLSYEAWDNNPLPGLQYYRLKQTDLDGQYSYSDLVAVDFARKGAGFEILNVFGTAEQNGEFQVEFVYDSELPLTAVVTDASGRVVLRQDNLNASPGINRLGFGQALPRGIYFILLQNQEKAVNRKFFY